MKFKIIILSAIAGLLISISGCGKSEQSSQPASSAALTGITEITATKATPTLADSIANSVTTPKITEQEATEPYEDYDNDNNYFIEPDYEQETTNSAGLVYDDNGNAIVAKRID